MKKNLIALLCTLISLTAFSQSRIRTHVPLDSIVLSDPCILPDSATMTYYMTGTGGKLWKSKDLKYWDGPYDVAQTDPQSWMGPNPMIWAAELHRYKGKYYYFATFTNRDLLLGTYRGNKLERRADGIYINGQKTDTYTFQMDYYWMMGDNRHNSLDSRYWGFVPEDHVVGRPIVVWLSLDKDRGWFDGKIRWNRLFKIVKDE